MNTDNQNLNNNNATLTLVGVTADGYAHILTDGALAFVAKLEAAYGGRRLELLQRRVGVQA
ncbi:MAG: hypothetical protein KAR62_06485, partial [Sphingomonadales bacterium]|nr:hypothetical protein [Sphingomonadales bacterium]